MRSKLFAGASGFAHLRGFGGKRRAEDDRPGEEPKGKRSKAADEVDDEDEPKGKRSRAEDDPPKDDDQPKGKGSKAADEGDDEDQPKGKGSKGADDDERPGCDDEHEQYPDEDEDENPPKGKGSKARRAEDGDDDDEQEMRGQSAAASARRRERARCEAIFRAADDGNVDLAASLAFETTMTRGEAIRVLKGQADRAPRRDDRSAGRRARNPDLGSGGGAPPDAKQAVRKIWDAGMAKAGVPAAS